MFVTHSYAWLIWLLFWCCCCLVVNEGRTVIIIDSSSSESDPPPSNNLNPCCTDYIKNYGETDVDCGGSECPKCESMKSCKLDCDCISDVCKNNTCAPNESCEDNIKNQDETDIDCGGIMCPKCENSMNCKKNSDCISCLCKNQTCTPVETCSDRIKNQDETGIDCGGNSCPSCNNTVTCKNDSDCGRNICRNNTCVVPATCNDRIKNQDETDIDCGGITCPKCVDTMVCMNDSDCIGNICENNQCVSVVTCDDNIRNQDETDIDCGGVSCPRCNNTRICRTNNDCISGFCDPNHVCTGIFYNQPNLSPCARWNPNATTFANSTTIGLQPRRIFINTENTVFVSSSDSNKVIVWTDGNDIPTRIISGGLNNSHGLFVTDNGDIYVDNGDANRRVDKWTPNATVSVPVMNITSRCYFMFIDINRTLYCTLDLEHKVVKMSLFDSSKTVTVAAGNGSSGAGPLMLYHPNGIVIDLNFNLYVADQGNNRIQIFHPGNLTGSTLSTGSYTLDHPSDLGFDADGYLFIVEYQRNRVIRSSPTGFICVIGCSSLAGSTSYQLNYPFQISFDSFGSLFVVDQNNARIQKFSLATNSCPTGSCEDQIKNQDETDIDCGGMICSKCNNTMACKNNSDCISNNCKNTICAPHETCNDRLKNQDETDVDCGGIVCPKCNDTRVCKNNSDCLSNICKNNTCVPPETCTDRIKNQDETDVDCGGIVCLKCNNTRVCKNNTDCISGSCKNNTCVPLETCNDRIKNQDETDIDCGGIVCPKCNNTRVCKNNPDCLSNICKSNMCFQPETCTDRIKNQNETDVDCGGNACPKCNNTKTCITYSDCISNFCNRNRVCSVGCVPTCKNGGTCISDNNCSCPTGYTGPTCEIQSFGLCSSSDTFGVTPILLITFGRGSSQYSSARPSSFNFSTTYIQRFEPVTNDGMFSFINSVHNDFADTWHTGAKDHTGNGGGYMLLVNADYAPGQFYNGIVNNLCVGLRYEFSVYLANLCRSTYIRIKPNVRFEVRDPLNNNNLLARLSSGEVPPTSTLTWQKYGLSFTATSSTVVLLMISDASGGMGNDIVIDDIGLRVCSQGGSGFCPSK